MFSFNPLFEREWRGRFRPLTSHLQLALIVAILAALVCFGVWRGAFTTGATVTQWRMEGRALLDGYCWLGALVFWSGALLIGATSVSDEKAHSTWEHLLLCPVGGRGLAVGKIASGAAWLLIIQIVLLPPLLVAGRCFGVTPTEIAAVMLSHLILTVQGATLGFWGALRAETLLNGIAEAMAAIGRILMQCLLVAFISGWVLMMIGIVMRALFGLPIPGLNALFKAVWPTILLVLFFIGQVLGSLVSGFVGVGVALRAFHAVGDLLMPLPLIAGQLLSIALFVKWSAWAIDHPTRDFWGVTPTGYQHKINDHLRVLYRVWSWELTNHQLNAFPIWERREAPNKFQAVLPTLEQAFGQLQIPRPTPKANDAKARTSTKRLRAPVSRRWQELNPVLWLDLTRCLSLRSPDSAMLPILLAIGALGGSMLLAVSLFLLVGWIQNSFGSSRGDVSSMATTWGQLHWMLTWSALACGPLWGAMGYVIERRTGMLIELRLTLITALEMWVGKFAARFGIFATLSVPLLSLVAFFAWNWPNKNASFEVASALLSSWSLGAWSVCACLWLSDSCRRDLSAALWSGSFGLGWGLLLWNFPAFSWLPLHIIGATLAGGHLLWRLKRLGFG
ncbi:hypothetical protein EON83_00360 [bacterium]|nr:MAG: hypothetical protein EON83_00360 [bacterium]